VCKDFIFWRRIPNANPLNLKDSQCEPEPQQSSQSQLSEGAPADIDGFPVIWGDCDDKRWLSGVAEGSAAGPIMHTELGKYFARLIAVDGDGHCIPPPMQPCAGVGTGLGDPRWQQPHTFGYEPNMLLRRFYPVPSPAVVEKGESYGNQDTSCAPDLRYTTDDATSTEKRKARGLSTD
jgi:hypothetical protein